MLQASCLSFGRCVDPLGHKRVNLWDIRERHRELLREARHARLARELSRARADRGDRLPAGEGSAHAPKHWKARQGAPEDAPRIAALLELNGTSCWVAFEERFLLVEEAGEIVAALCFRQDFERLYTGFLVTVPWLEERPLANALYNGARDAARRIGLKEVRVQAPRSATYLREAGYRRRTGGWRLKITDRS